MTEQKNQHKRELLEKYGHKIRNLPNDGRRKVAVFDTFSKKEMKIQYHHLKNHIESGRHKSAEQHYQDSSFNKFKERFNL